jgi:hypothetical protein
MGRGLFAVVLALVVACTSDPYPMPSQPPHSSQRNPAAVGEPTNAVLIFMTVRPGDRIELLGADAIGTTKGASVRFLLSRPINEADGTILIGEDFEDLEGSVVTAPQSSSGGIYSVGIAAELTPHEPGRFEITNVRLRYRLNGGAEQTGEGIEVVWTVCAEDPKPHDCPEAA